MPVVKPPANTLDLEPLRNLHFPLRSTSVQALINPHAPEVQQVMKLLDEVCRGVVKPEVRAQLHLTPPTLKDRLCLLQYLEPAQRLHFACRSYSLYKENKCSAEVALPTLSRAAIFLSPCEKKDFASFLLNTRPRYKAAECLLTVLRQCRSLYELKTVVKGVKEESILRLQKAVTVNDLRVKEQLGDLLALVNILPGLRKCTGHIQLVSGRGRERQSHRTISQLRNSFDEVTTILKSSSAPPWSNVPGNFEKVVTQNQILLKEIEAKASVMTARELRDAVNAVVLKSRMEFRYHLFFSNSKNRRWKINELKEFNSEVARGVPEKLLLFTPELFELRRVSAIDGTLAHRTSEGKIEFTDAVFEGERYEGRYVTKSCFTMTALHEIGHAFQMGTISTVKDPEHPFFLGDPVADFSGYLQLGGWQEIDFTRFRLNSENKDFVLLDGMHEVPLRQPVYFEGRTVVFSFPRGEGSHILLAYDAAADFSPHPDSRDDPCEDLAESFAHYIANPKGLALCSPEKFSFHESLLGKYRHHVSVKSVYTATLQSRLRNSLVVNEFEDFLAQRFSKLTHREQAFVLAAISANEVGLKPLEDYTSIRYFQDLSQQERSQAFVALTHNRDWPELQKVCDALFAQYASYRPPLVEMLTLLKENKAVGILTRRENRQEHASVLDALDDFLHVQLPRKNTYFINDIERNRRLRARTDEGRIFEVLRDFARGYFRDSNGDKQQLSRRYAKVVFHTADTYLERQLKIRCSKLPLPLRKRILITNTRDVNLPRLWPRLLDAVWYNEAEFRKTSSEIHFFGLDDVLLRSATSVNVYDRTTQSVVSSIPREEYSRNPDPDRWLTRVSRKEKIARSRLSLDFSEVRKAKKIFALPDRMFHQE